MKSEWKIHPGKIIVLIKLPGKFGQTSSSFGGFDGHFSYDFVIRETIQRHVESLKRNYGAFNEGLPSYEETNFGIDNRADQIMLPSDQQASPFSTYSTEYFTTLFTVLYNRFLLMKDPVMLS